MNSTNGISNNQVPSPSVQLDNAQVIEKEIAAIETIASDYLMRNEDALQQYKNNIIKLKNSIIQNIKNYHSSGYPEDKLAKKINAYKQELNQQIYFFEEAKKDYRTNIQSTNQKADKLKNHIDRLELPSFEESSANKKTIPRDHPVLDGLSKKHADTRRAILSLALQEKAHGNIDYFKEKKLGE